MEKKTSQFKAEITRMLDLVVNSLYSKNEIFLRELVSNASDAIDRARYQGLTDVSLVADAPEWKIEIFADSAAKTLSVSDNGIGMDAEGLENSLGTIAASGTKEFREALEKKGGEATPELIGQFGVGFYAAFMAADRVRVVSKKRGTSQAYAWESSLDGGYSIEECERDGWGTTVELHLREGREEYLDRWRVSELVKKYSDFIAYPILFASSAPDGEKEEDRKRREENEAKPLNTMTALWKRPKKDVKDGEYAEFYRHLTRDWEDPLVTIPFSGEGQVEFKALLFIPKRATMELYVPDRRRGLSLYVRNVFIGDDMEMLLPPWLRFVKGVVDSSDLPLNVSREMLQDDATAAKIKSAISSKVLSTLEETKRKDAAKYGEIWAAFGQILKEGAYGDRASAPRLEKLLKFPTARGEAGKPVFLEDYAKDMASGQKDIYFVVAQREEDARRAPQAEAARKHGCDVLLFCDPVDGFLAETLREFDGHPLVDLGRGEVFFGGEDEKKAAKKAAEKAAEDAKPFLDAVKKRLEGKVSDVRASSRLAGSPCCLVARENALSPTMARMMRAMNETVPDEKRILEIDLSHPLVAKMAQEAPGEALDGRIDMLYDAALVAEGSPVEDGAGFAKRIADLMMK